MTAAERLEHPPLFRALPLRLALLARRPGDVRATADEVAAFRTWAQVGDPLADDLVRELAGMTGGAGRRAFDQALAEGIDSLDSPPAALDAFFRTVEARPDWLDEAQLETASRAMVRSGLYGIYGPLLDISLLGGYLSWRPGKVLVATGDLARKAPVRLTETSNWWVEVTSPGGLRRDAPGFAGILRVRIMHAHVRAAMLRRDDWEEEWDHPLNQSQTVGTLVLFSLVFVLGLDLLGFRFTKQERAAIFHFWRYVGWLMGVDEEILPADELETWRTTWIEAYTELGPDDDSRRLAAALMAAIPTLHGIDGSRRGDRVRTWCVRGLHAAYSRLALGGKQAGLLGVPRRPGFTVVVLAFAAGNSLFELVRMLVPGMTRRRTQRGDRRRRARMASRTEATRANLTYSRD